MEYLTTLKNILIGILTFLVAPVFCQTQNCEHNLNHPNYHSIVQVVSSETIVREYILYVPTNYDAATATPLVINMHGFGGCAADHAEEIGGFYNFNDLADQENFIVAYPQGAWRPEKDDTYWEPGDTGVENLYDNDVYFLEQLVSEIDIEYNVDMNKVFACGYSNGGMMAYSLACNSSSLFSGIGIMSGALLDDDCTLDNPVPIITFHGVADFVLPYNGDQWYASVEETINFWLDQNNIPQSSLVSTELNNGDVVRDEYIGDTENSCVTLYTIHEEWGDAGGHVWFSDDIDGTNPSQIMWDFFNGNCSPLTSTEESVESNLTLKIQPNPFSNFINITSNSSTSQVFSISNLQGISLISGTINAFPYTLELNDLPPNIYILNVGGTIQKLIKRE